MNSIYCKTQNYCKQESVFRICIHLKVPQKHLYKSTIKNNGYYQLHTR